VRIISRKPLREFAKEHADAKTPLDAWFSIMKGKMYVNPHEVRKDFPAASFLGDRRTVFNIGGNKYRLVVDMRYDLGRIYIREVLSHDDYERKTREGSI
jgi:mRNA interferase HigB